MMNNHQPKNKQTKNNNTGTYQKRYPTSKDKEAATKG